MFTALPNADERQRVIAYLKTLGPRTSSKN